MDLHQLRCFVNAADELHFGRAAQRMGMLPAALGRHIRLLEEDLGTRLLDRTTRNVALTRDGALLLDDARLLLAEADRIATSLRQHGRSLTNRSHGGILRVGAIDSAAAGLLPLILQDFRRLHPKVTVQLLEDKTIRLLPKLLNGRLDLAFVRPPETPDPRLQSLFLFHETAMVAVPAGHRLATRRHLDILDLADESVIVPERRSRPHSHDLTMKLFADAGLTAVIAQIAEEKQTIVNLVAAGLGVAIVPRWTSRLARDGVRYITLRLKGAGPMRRLPLAAFWVKGSRDTLRDEMMAGIAARLAQYEAEA